jgi:hypothetical protein
VITDIQANPNNYNLDFILEMSSVDEKYSEYSKLLESFQILQIKSEEDG